MVRQVGARNVMRDARMRRFISRLVKADDKNMRVCGAQVISYEIIDYRQRQAILKLLGGVEVEASFVEVRKKRKAISCFNAMSQVTHQSVLTPIFISYDKEKHRTLLFYQRYDSLLDESRQGNEIWWQQAIREQIQAIRYMHKKGFIHTGLNNPTNYAIKDNKLKLLNITSSLQDYLKNHPQADGERIKTDNFTSLRDLMRQRYMEKKSLTRDDEAFFQLFDRVDLSYEDYTHKLITHPYAKDYRQCMNEFHDIHLLDEQKLLYQPLSEVTKGEVFNPYRGWMRRIRNSNAKNLKRALPRTAGQGQRPVLREDDVETLVKFLRNVNEHRGQDWRSVDHYFQTVYKEVKKQFPGLLSMVHQEIKIKNPKS